MLYKNIIIKKSNKRFNISLNEKIIIAKGPLGSITYNFGKDCIFFNNKLFLKRKKVINFIKNKINYLYHSVTKGWYSEIKLNGLGYKCFKHDDKLSFDIGYSVLLNYIPDKKIKIKIFKNKILIFSIDRLHLMKLINILKNYAIPDPYKGKGIIINNNKILLKKKARR